MDAILGLLHSIVVPAGYSRRRLVEKLDLKPGSRAHLRGAPPDYMELLGDLPEGVELRRTLRSPVNFIQAFFTAEGKLARELPSLRDALQPGGSLWISWPKKASGVATDITEDVVRRIALANGLVDVKVCAVDELWSGLKLMFRRKDRERMTRKSA
jgi:hypothetical protein